MKVPTSKFYIILFVLGLMILALSVAAQGIEIPNPLKADTFEELVDSLIDFIFKMAMAVAPIMIIIAGFIFVTSGGDPRGVQKAKDMLLYTAIGISVIVLSKGLIEVIKQLFSGST